MFRSTNEYNTILTELNEYGIMSDVANFKCFADGAATYWLHKDGAHHEFSIMTDIFFDNMKVEDLLNAPKVELFSYTVFKDHVTMFDCIYSCNITYGIN